jgi:hypothetical protein
MWWGDHHAPITVYVGTPWCFEEKIPENFDEEPTL